MQNTKFILHEMYATIKLNNFLNFLNGKVLVVERKYISI